LDKAEEVVAAGADHLIVMVGHPFDLAPVEKILAKR
jgi:hypothetical protein